MIPDSTTPSPIIARDTGHATSKTPSDPAATATRTTPPMRSGASFGGDSKPVDPTHVYGSASGIALFTGKELLAGIAAFSELNVADAKKELAKEQAEFDKLGRVTRFFTDPPAMKTDADLVTRYRAWDVLPYDIKGVQSRHRDPVSVALQDMVRGGFLESKAIPDYDYEQGRVVIASFHEEYRLTAAGKALVGNIADPQATIDAMKAKKKRLQEALG
jgi:hypothetical protein